MESRKVALSASDVPAQSGAQSWRQPEVRSAPVLVTTNVELFLGAVQGSKGNTIPYPHASQAQESKCAVPTQGETQKYLETDWTN